MKKIIFTFALLVIFFSCKKEITQNSDNNLFLAKIKIQLKDSIAENDFIELVFNNSVITKFEQKDLTILRIPFRNKSIATDFILLKIENNQSFSIGKIISLTKNQADNTSKSKFGFNGKILIYSLSRHLTTNSLITNGYIESFHYTGKNVHGKPLVVPSPYVDLPEVVITASYPPGVNVWSYYDWYNIQSMLFESNIYDGGGGGGGGAGGNAGGYYDNSDPGGPGLLGASPTTDNTLHIDFEREDLPAIDVSKYLKCFSNIPDAGATCTIKILTDIPVDSDPTIFFSTENGSPGHTFIQITKINGSQSVQQNIGFYPVQGWKVLTTLPSDGKFVDNASHEYNASLSMNLTPDKFQNTLSHIQVLANVIKYDIAKSNCIDFALDVFNFQRGANQLIIPQYSIPGDSVPAGSNTPQGLYISLKEIKQSLTNPESKNVIIPRVKGFAGDSNGPCI